MYYTYMYYHGTTLITITEAKIWNSFHVSPSYMHVSRPLKVTTILASVGFLLLLFLVGFFCISIKSYFSLWFYLAHSRYYSLILPI